MLSKASASSRLDIGTILKFSNNSFRHSRTLESLDSLSRPFFLKHFSNRYVIVYMLPMEM